MTTRRIRIRWVRVAGVLVFVAAIAAAVGHQSQGSSSSPRPSPASSPSTASAPTTGASQIEIAPSWPSGPLGEADGAVPDDTTVFDDEVPGVANLDPLLLGALRRAATDAAGDGVEFHVDSG